MDTTTTVTDLAPKTPFFINRNFGLLWIGQSISDLGDMIYFVTLALWIATVIAKNQPWAPLAGRLLLRYPRLLLPHSQEFLWIVGISD